MPCQRLLALSSLRHHLIYGIVYQDRPGQRSSATGKWRLRGQKNANKWVKNFCVHSCMKRTAAPPLGLRKLRTEDQGDRCGRHAQATWGRSDKNIDASQLHQALGLDEASDHEFSDPNTGTRGRVAEKRQAISGIKSRRDVGNAGNACQCNPRLWLPDLAHSTD